MIHSFQTKFEENEMMNTMNYAKWINPKHLDGSASLQQHYISG